MAMNGTPLHLKVPGATFGLRGSPIKTMVFDLFRIRHQAAEELGPTGLSLIAPREPVSETVAIDLVWIDSEQMKNHRVCLSPKSPLRTSRSGSRMT